MATPVKKVYNKNNNSREDVVSIIQMTGRNSTFFYLIVIPKSKTIRRSSTKFYFCHDHTSYFPIIFNVLLCKGKLNCSLNKMIAWWCEDYIPA